MLSRAGFILEQRVLICRFSEVIGLPSCGPQPGGSESVALL